MKDILIWLAMFVVGSLIVSVIVSPDVYYDLKDRVLDSKNSFVNVASQNTIENRIKFIPSEMDEYWVYKSYLESCAAVEVYGEMDGVSNVKQKLCRQACGFNDMEYSSFGCERDLFVCYCVL